MRILVHTFKERHNATPAGDRSLAVKLAEGEFHVEEGNPANDEHDAVGHKKRT